MFTLIVLLLKVAVVGVAILCVFAFVLGFLIDLIAMTVNWPPPSRRYASSSGRPNLAGNSWEGGPYRKRS